MSEKEAEITEPKSMFFAVTLCECILAVLLIAGALAIKFFFPKTYDGAKRWYEKNLTPDTNITEIIKNNEI